MDITRVGRGFVCRIGVRQERLRLANEEAKRFAAEEHAVAVAADVAVAEILVYLAGACYAITTVAFIRLHCSSDLSFDYFRARLLRNY